MQTIARTKTKTLRSFRGPVTIWLITLTFISFFVMQFVRTGGTLSNRAATSIASNSQLVQAGILIGGALMEIGLIWATDWLIKFHPVILFISQLAFAFITTLTFSGDMPIFLIGIFPVIAIEVINLYQRPRALITAMSVLYLAAWVPYSIANGWLQGVIVLQSMIFMMCVLFYYWNYYAKQVAERNHAEDLVAELKVAYAQVEAATVRTERQRVARELHDTLTQGLAGTVMQLEAAQSFLTKGDTARVAEILASSINISRETLRESRLTLTDLRSTTEESLTARIELLTDAFKKNYGLHVTTHLNDVPDYSNAQLTEITRIVSEALVNVVKHTDGKEVVLRGTTANDSFTLKVIDFGNNKPTERQSRRPAKGHYGMQGMHERAASLDGALTVVTTPDEGTTVTLTMPTLRKEQL